MLEPAKVKADFPLLVAKPDVAYLDNAATAQKPAAVLEAMDRFYRNDYGSVRRSVHVLAEATTAAYEGARQSVAGFIGANAAEEIVFTRGTTEAINLVMYGWARDNLSSGDVVVITEMEHHANYVPWRVLS